MSVLCKCVIATYFAYCRIFQQSAHIAYFFLHKLAFSTSILILFVFLLPISIRFCYLDHLVANRMAPSRWMDPCGMRWGSWFQAIRYHISATYLVSMQSTYFFKCRIKLTCLTSFVCICLWVQCNCRVCIFDAVCDCVTILVQELCWHCSLLLL